MNLQDLKGMLQKIIPGSEAHKEMMGILDSKPKGKGISRVSEIYDKEKENARYGKSMRAEAVRRWNAGEFDTDPETKRMRESKPKEKTEYGD